MTPPATAHAYEELLKGGKLVDLGGRVLRRYKCRWCNGTTVGETCPLSLPCPECKQDRGQPCLTTTPHEARLRLSHARDDQREREGDISVPARWDAQPS